MAPYRPYTAVQYSSWIDEFPMSQKIELEFELKKVGVFSFLFSNMSLFFEHRTKIFVDL